MDICRVVISPRTDGDHERLQRALSLLAGEDSSIRVKTESVHGQTILSGMSDEHLEVICNRILHEYEIPIDVGWPTVIYLETIREPAEGVRRQLPRAGFKRNGLQDSRHHGLQGSGQKGRARANRAGHGRRDNGPGTTPGHHLPKPPCAPRADRGRRTRGRIADHQGRCAPAEMLGYGREIRVSTQGRAYHTMQFVRYEAAPRHDELGGDGAGVTANKPVRPSGGTGSAVARFDSQPE